MISRAQVTRQNLLVPILAIIGTIVSCAYSVIATMSADPLWFLGRASVPDPRWISIRVDGEQTVLTAESPDYELIVQAVREAMSEFKHLAPLTAGLSEETLAEYQHSGTILELHFYEDESVDFNLPFNDRKPTALLIPIEGRHAGKGYVFRGKDGEWWPGQMVMSNPRPLLDALSTLGYVRP